MCIETVKDLLYFLSLQNILNRWLMLKSDVMFFFAFLCHNSPRYLLNWSVTKQCFWHPRWECGRQWDFYCKNERGWTAALHPIVLGPELLSLSTCRVCHRGRSVTVSVADIFLFLLNWESNEWTELSSGQPVAAGLGSWYTSRGHCDLRGLVIVWNLTLYDFYSLRVCIYKYICVFIFNIEHTHIISTPNCACVKHAPCALVETHSSAVVCCTLEKKRCTIHFPYIEFNQ